MTMGTHISHFRVFQIAFRMSCVPPLPDKAGIGRYNDFLFGLTDTKYSLHIFLGSRRKNIKAIVIMICRQFQNITFADHTIKFFMSFQLKRYSMHIYLSRNQFGSVRIARLKVCCSFKLIPTKTLLIISKK